MPNANNIIIYNKTSRNIVARLAGDPSQIVLNTNEDKLVLDYTDGIDNRKVNETLDGIESLNSFDSGYWDGNYDYRIDNLPDNTQVILSDGSEYTVNGSVSVHVPSWTSMTIELSATGYATRQYTVFNEYEDTGGGGSGNDWDIF